MCEPDTFVDGESGSLALRNSIGVHGNLKPENILWVFQISEASQHKEGHSRIYGRLVVDDFGIAEFYGETGLQLDFSGRDNPTYRSAEFDIDGKSSDIWSLGCVMLEFVVWYFQGMLAWDKFSQDRCHEDLNLPIREDVYFEIRKETRPDEIPTTTWRSSLKPSVIKKVEELRADPKITQFLVDLLNMIEEKMLKMNPRDRATCDDIVGDLTAIHNRCLRSEEYCINPVSGSRSLEGPSAYTLFANEQYENVRRENPGITFVEVENLLGEHWKALNERQRAPYEAKASAAEFKRRYERREWITTDAMSNIDDSDALNSAPPYPI